MYLLRFVPLLLTPILAAQVQPGQPQPATKPTQAPTPETKKPEPTPQERIAKLKARLHKLQQEQAYIDKLSQSGGLKSQVQSFFKERELSAKTITDTSAPAVQPTPPSAPQQQKARLLGDDEKAKFGADVVFAVDGMPVTKDEMTTTVAFLESAGAASGTVNERAILWLMRRKAAQAAFQEESRTARNTILAAQRKLQEGGDFAEVAKEMLQCPSGSRGGVLGDVGRDNEGWDLFFRQAAFDTKVGETSDVIETTFGYHLIKVTGKKGEGDTAPVTTSHILALYHPDQAQVRQVRNRVDRGQVDLAFVDDEHRKFAPPAYR